MNRQPDQLPPFDVESEQGALACVLIANGNGRELRDQLSNDHFYLEGNRAIYRALRQCKSPDTVSLLQWARDHNQTEALGGIEYLGSLADKTPSAANFEFYLETLEGCKIRRAALNDSAELALLARDTTIPASTIADAARRMLEGHAEKGSGLLSEEQLTARQFDPSKPPPPLTAIYTLQEKVIATPGNLQTITAAVKAGKSAALGAMVAAACAEPDTDADLLGFWSSNLNGLALVHFDSEQSPEDHWWLIHRALKRAGLTAPPAWLFSYCLTGMGARAAWVFVKQALQGAADKCRGVHSAFLDGSADLVSDVNDAAECNAFVAELHALAIKNFCPITSVIHFNPGSEKSRGHLGSQLERKAETNLRLEKTDAVTEIFSDKQRRAPIPRGTGPCFTWDDEAGMHISTETRQKAINDENKEREKMLVDESFLDHPSLHYSDIISTVKRLKKCSDRTAERRVAKWDKLGLLRKSVAGLWVKAI